MEIHELSSSSQKHEKAAVKEAFRNTYSAMLEGNIDRMEKLLSEDFEFTHMNRRIQTKKECQLTG